VGCLTVEWSKLTDDDFESLCYDVLAAEEYKNLKWIGRKGGDRGRDILATKSMKITDAHEPTFEFLIQCKRYVAHPPGPSELQNTLAWADAHTPDFLMIMVSNTLTSDTHDWLDQIRPQKKYHILVYDEKAFEQFFDRNGKVYLKHFGKVRVSPRKLILSSLLRSRDQTIQMISNATQLSKDEIETILRNLEQQRIVSHGGSEGKSLYNLERNLTTFVGLAEEFLVDETKRSEFMLSDYCQSQIGPELVTHIESRYHLALDADQRVALARLLKISVSALNAALFLPTGKYDTLLAHMKELGIQGDERNRWSQSLFTEFIATLLEKTIADLRDPDIKPALKQNKVEGYNIGIKIKMANSKEPVLNLGVEETIMLLKAQGSIKAGQLVAATDPDLFLRTGDILLHLELIELAIGEYEKAIPGLKDTQKLAAAWNNKGVCLMRLQRWIKAIPCFDKALAICPTEETRKNKEKCEAAVRQDQEDTDQSNT
jgi:tetratricopeptide (TPR) repeat protein